MRTRSRHAVLTLATILLATAPPRARAADDYDLDEIKRCSVERAAWIVEHDVESRYEFDLFVTGERLRRDGSVKKKEERRYREINVGGERYARLLEKDGRPLTEKERRKEAKAERKHLKKLRRRKRGKDGDEEGFRFDAKLIDRYESVVDGIGSVGGRAAWVISYTPKPGLAAKTRFDLALNKSTGRIFIDIETYEVSRVEFELTGKIKVWWGFLGHISVMTGHVERLPIEPDMWFPTRFDLYLNGRMLFKSLHGRRSIEWSDFEPVAADNQLRASSTGDQPRTAVTATH